MTARPHSSGSHHAELLWVTILVILLMSFLVDAAGWFHTGWLW